MIRPPKTIITSVRTPAAIQEREEQLNEEQETAEVKVEEKKKETPKPVEKKENKVEQQPTAPKFQNKL